MTARRPERSPNHVPPTSLIADAPAVDLLYGDRVPKRGVATRGVLLYEDGELVGECVRTDIVMTVGPAGAPLDYEQHHYTPLADAASEAADG